MMISGRRATRAALAPVRRYRPGPDLDFVSDLSAPVVRPRDQSPYYVYLASLTSAESRRTMRLALQQLAHRVGNCTAAEFPWHLLRAQHVEAIRTRLSEQLAPATVNRILSAIKGVTRRAARLRLMSRDDAADVLDVRGVRGERVPPGRMLSLQEQQALLDACGTHLRGRRDAALVAVLCGCGLRRAEIAALRVTDVNVPARELLVLGKGNRERLMPLPESTAEELRRWLEARTDASPWLFPPFQKGGVPRRNRRMTGHGVAAVLHEIARRAGFQLDESAQRFTAHDLRRTYISSLFRHTDIATVRDLAGHRLLETTKRYDVRPKEEKHRAVSRLVLPVSKPTT